MTVADDGHGLLKNNNVVCLCQSIYVRVHIWQLRRRLQSRTGFDGSEAGCFAIWRVSLCRRELQEVRRNNSWGCTMLHDDTHTHLPILYRGCTVCGTVMMMCGSDT